MEKNLLNEIIEKTRALIDAPTCSKETKEAAVRWLEAAGTEREKEETVSYIAELEEDIMPIDQLIGFAGSAKGEEYFGADAAKGIAVHAREIKAAGSKILRLSRMLCSRRYSQKKRRYAPVIP